MRIMARVILMMIVTGCAPVGSVENQASPLCDMTDDLRRDHSAALALDGGDRSVTSGRALIAALDAGCDG